MTISMKKITTEDVETLQKISIKTFDDTFGEFNSKSDLEKMYETNYNKEQLSQEINDDNSDFEFIFVDNQLAGYLKINFSEAQSEKMGNDFEEVERIYILKEFKRRGLGTHLMNYALDEGRKKNKKEIWLGVWENNINAIKFYEEKGFKPFSEHVFTVGSDKQKDILMKKNIKKEP